MFDSFEACERVYDELPASFTAADVEQSGLTGGRRHMLVWHYAEHPAFDCELASRQPLTVEKATRVEDGVACDEGGDATANMDESTDVDYMGVMPADD